MSAWEAPCGCDQSQQLPAKKGRWSEGQKYAKTHNLQEVCCKTVFVAGRQGARCGGQIHIYKPDLLSLCQAITCTAVSTGDREIKIRHLCASYQHECRVTVPQTFCQNNHSRDWEGKLSLYNGQSKVLSCFSVQKQLLGLVVEKTTRSLPSHLKYHLTGLMELAHGPPAHHVLFCPLPPSPVYPCTQPVGTLEACGGRDVQQYLPEAIGQEEVKSS